MWWKRINISVNTVLRNCLVEEKIKWKNKTTFKTLANLYGANVYNRKSRYEVYSPTNSVWVLAKIELHILTACVTLRPNSAFALLGKVRESESLVLFGADMFDADCSWYTLTLYRRLKFLVDSLEVKTSSASTTKSSLKLFPMWNFISTIEPCQVVPKKC